MTKKVRNIEQMRVIGKNLIKQIYEFFYPFIDFIKYRLIL